MTSERTNRTADFCLLFLLSALWGSSYTFIKIGVETIPPITLIAARTLIAGSLLLVLVKARVPLAAAGPRKLGPLSVSGLP